MGIMKKKLEQGLGMVRGKLTEIVAEVYVDVLLLVNFVMDFFIIWAAGKLAHVKTSLPRIILAAILGAAYSLVVFFPDASYLSTLLAKVAFSLLMIIAAFAPFSVRAFLRSLVYFYLVSFAMGGAIIGITYLTDELPWSLQAINGAAAYFEVFHPGMLLIGLGVAIVSGLGGILYLRRSWLQDQLLNKLIINLNGNELEVPALLDTGNQLVDPLSQKPVIVVEYQILKNILPPDICVCFSDKGEFSPAGCLENLSPDWAGRIRLIPYNSVGRNDGMMLGIKPDMVEVINREGRTGTREVVIGVLNKTLNKDGRFHALLHPAVFQG